MSGYTVYISPTDCNRVLKGPRGVITTPNFPNPYPHDRNCTWVIEAPQGNSINASFSDFVLEDHMNQETGECYYDFVEVCLMVLALFVSY